MKVTRSTEHRLIVEDRPILISAVLALFLLGTLIAAVAFWGAGQVLMGIVFTVFCALVALFLALFLRRVQIIFDRLAGTITFRTRNLRRYEEVIYPLTEFSHAEREGYDTARCVLVFDKGMSAGRVPVTTYSDNSARPKRVTDAINAWHKAAAPVDSEPPKA